MARARRVAFTVTAPLMGAVTYGVVGGAGRILPFAGESAEQVILLSGGAATVLWYGVRRFTWLPSPLRQMRQRVAEAGVRGAVVYGAVLGMGLLTIISSPLVWIGTIAVVASGSAQWGIAYGLSFDAGRVGHFWWQRSLGLPKDPSELPRRVIGRGSPWIRAVGVVTGLLVGALGLVGL